MADMVKASIGFLLLFLAVVIRFFVFTQEFLQNFIGMDVNEAYALIEKIKLADPLIFIIVIAISLLLIIWGLEG